MPLLYCCSGFVNLAAIFQEQSTSFIEAIDAALADKHDSLALSHPKSLTPQTNNKTKVTESPSGEGGGADSLYQADEAVTAVSEYIKDLDLRFDKTDAGLIAAYRNLFNVGGEDRSTEQNIERLKQMNTDLIAATIEVNI